MRSVVDVSRRLVESLEGIEFGGQVTHVYNPLVYARKPHERYLRLFGAGKKEVLLLGMNPGPFGMAQTGVPFGDVEMVRGWLGIEEAVGKPAREHPKRLVNGFGCGRREVSGTRLWGWARDRFETPERFFERFFIWNYCPLCFMEESGRNRTPDKLAPEERERLYACCDDALAWLVASVEPKYVIGVGKFGADRARKALGDRDVTIGWIPHPSPANPMANRNWAALADSGLASLGISIP